MTFDLTPLHFRAMDGAVLAKPHPKRSSVRIGGIVHLVTGIYLWPDSGVPAVFATACGTAYNFSAGNTRYRLCGKTVTCIPCAGPR